MRDILVFALLVITLTLLALGALEQELANHTPEILLP